MIQLTEKLEYDTELPYDEQSEGVKGFITNQMNTNIPQEEFEPAGVMPRVILQTWVFDNYEITQTYSYANPPESYKNGVISNMVIKIERI